MSAINTAVLVLDIDYRPLRVEHWHKVISDYFLGGKIEVVEYSRDRTIKGVTQTYPMPSVVRVLRRFKRDRQAIKFSRLNIYSRDAFTCQYCRAAFATEDLTFDHVIPRARGGRTSWENIVTACVDCNSQKGARTPEEAGMVLARQPKKPRTLPTVTVDVNRDRIPEEWAAYWTGGLDR
jgi:5-methylcytosine-specific restriction endonuclease McrA